MTRAPSLTATADPTREVPGGSAERLDRIDRALESLEREERRLVQLGLELPLLKCREQRRYWGFLRGLFAAVGDDDQREIA